MNRLENMFLVIALIHLDAQSGSCVCGFSSPCFRWVVSAWMNYVPCVSGILEVSGQVGSSGRHCYRTDTLELVLCCWDAKYGERPVNIQLDLVHNDSHSKKCKGSEISMEFISLLAER